MQQKCRTLRSRRAIAILVLIVVVVIVLIAYGVYRHLNHTPVAKPTAPEVTVLRLEYTPLPLTVTSFAQVVSPVSVTLNAQASGVISSIQFTPGQAVQKGAVLFTLQSNDTSTQLDQLKAQYEIANQLYQRDQKLAATGAIAQIELLQAQSTYQQNLAQYQEAKTIHTIIAPISGTISDTDVAVGDFVNIGDILASIIDPAHLQVKYQLPSQYQGQARVGQLVTFTPDAGDKTDTATVSYVSPLVSASDYNLTVRADLTHTTVALNTFGQVVQTLDPKHQALAVPQGVVQTDAQGFYVYVFNPDHTVAKQYFTPGEVTQSGLIIAASGLVAGVQIITSSPSDFNVGQTVTVSAS